MAKTRKNYYAVKVGRQPGIYRTWEECEKMVKGYTGAQFKGFMDYDEALEYLQQPNTGKRNATEECPDQPPAKRQKVEETTKSTESTEQVAPSTAQVATTAQVGPTTASVSPAVQVPTAQVGATNAQASPTAQVSPAAQVPTASQVAPTTTVIEVEQNAQEEVKEIIELEEQNDLSTPCSQLEEPLLVIYTDGACRGPSNYRRAGIGVWFGDNDPRNLAERLPGSVQTNQRAELYAAIRALESVHCTCPVEIRTDSAYLVHAATEWMHNWRKKNWQGKITNRDLFQRLDELIMQRTAPTYWTHVRGHVGEYGNEQADRLAVLATTMPDRT